MLCSHLSAHSVVWGGNIVQNIFSLDHVSLVTTKNCDWSSEEIEDLTLF